MLELKKITKVYKTEGFTQKALDDISINFRKCEFASILGPSGSGKTTLLNIIGGLDHYDSGDLIINETSTKKYKDRDWDSYRNHRIGFVFQNYNLIAHQSVLANVELALTLSGVSKKERRRRAKKVLEEVGLKNHINKKPTELSGGQMQRVAIARALVNNPEILLADEATGALDSTTSKQIMEILKNVSKDRLVIMVTHNPDIAKTYSTRIIKLQDGKITSDNNPYDGSTDTKLDEEEKKNKNKKTSMGFLTALNLSLNNLMTKKKRTLLTAFAGSIGIIGIALILSLSNGVNTYINNIQKETMLSYPIEIEEESYDLTSVIGNQTETTKTDTKKDGVYTDTSSLEMASSMTNSLNHNNLKKFKDYLENNKNINKYVGDSGIVYSYNTKFSVYSYDPDNVLINTDGSSFDVESAHATINDGSMTTSMNFQKSSLFSEILPSNNNDISKAIKESYEVVYGRYPKEYNEVVLVLNSNNQISLDDLYNLGILPSSEYKEIINKLDKNEDLKLTSKKIDYENIIDKTFKLLVKSDYYIKNDNRTFTDISSNNAKVEELINTKSIDLKVVGVIKLKEDSKNALIDSSVAYTRSLTNYIINHTNESEVVNAQINNKEENVVNGLKFSVNSNEEKQEEARRYLKNLSISEKAEIASNIILKINPNISDQLFTMSDEDLAESIDYFLLNPDSQTLINIYDNYISSGSYDENMSSFGYVDLDFPNKISIYADNFENKEKITKEIEKYNDKVSEEDKINYTDYVALLMSSVTTIVNAISYVLIFFVSISLIVSSIMIAIITYISVLERTKEIGILRAIGASKKDIRNVFNAETFIEGLTAGVMGILITLILNIPINLVIKELADIDNVSKLPLNGAIILIFISIILTVIAGLIPSRIAAKKDPVVSLRSE